MAEVGLHDRHVVGQLQALVRISRDGLASTLAIVNKPVVIAAQRVQEVQLVDYRLLHKVIDDEDQEGHAVRVVLTKAEPLGKLGAKLEPLLVVCNNKLKREAEEGRNIA